MQFLVLEDEPLIAMDIKFAFEDAGHCAHTAGSTDEALSLLRRFEFAAAVLDVNLGDGETCQKVAEYLHSRSIPFVLHTGDLDRAGEFVRTLEVPVIRKPYPVDDLVQRVIERSANS